MSDTIQVVVASRKRDKGLIVLATFLAFGGLFALPFTFIWGMIAIIAAIILYRVARFLDWWHRGLIGDARFDV